jgi:hypothetical protein
VIWWAIHSAVGLAVTLIHTRLASLKLDDHQAIEQLEANGRHGKHINGGDVRRVIAEIRTSRFGTVAPPSVHVLGDSRLRDLEAQLEQLTVDARRG